MTSPLLQKKPLINLLRGWPSPSLLPAAQLQDASQSALSDPSVSTPGLLYGPDDGYLPLRLEISRWLSSFYSCPDEPSRICITGGASQNLACALQVYTDPGITKAVWMVAPCYFLACRIFEDAGFAGRLRAVREDEEGIDVGYLESEIVKIGEGGSSGKAFKHPRPWSKTYDYIIYAVPNFSNPSGKTMSLQRRTQLIHLARSHNALIITDDVYDFLQWPTTPLPANRSSSSRTTQAPRALLPRLTDIDHLLPAHASDPDGFHHTLSNGSFSKILGPGVRTGWAATASPTLSYGLSQCGSTRSGGCPSQLVAALITQLLATGRLQTHIREVLIPSYARRWRRTMDAIETRLVPLGVCVSRVSLEGTDVFGGYFVWFELPEGVSAERVAARAKESEELIVAQGGIFEVYGDEETVRLEQWVRVCFAWEEEELLVEGIERLGRVIVDVLGEKVEGGKENGRDLQKLKTPMGGF